MRLTLFKNSAIINSQDWDSVEEKPTHLNCIRKEGDIEYTVVFPKSGFTSAQIVDSNFHVQVVKGEFKKDEEL